MIKGITSDHALIAGSTLKERFYANRLHEVCFQIDDDNAQPNYTEIDFSVRVGTQLILPPTNSGMLNYLNSYEKGNYMNFDASTASDSVVFAVDFGSYPVKDGEEIEVSVKNNDPGSTCTITVVANIDDDYSGPAFQYATRSDNNYKLDNVVLILAHETAIDESSTILEIVKGNVRASNTLADIFTFQKSQATLPNMNNHSYLIVYEDEVPYDMEIDLDVTTVLIRQQVEATHIAEAVKADVFKIRKSIANYPRRTMQQLKFYGVK
jgi:hypothetical protein